MDADSWLLLLLFILFVIFSAYFACSESAFSALNSMKVKSRADDGDRKAKNALYISNHFERALTTLLVGINIAHIASASLATLLARHWFPEIPEDRLTLLCTLVTTGIVFLFGEMIPKSLANDRSESVSLACAGLLRILMKVLYPLVVFFSWIGEHFAALFHTTNEPTYTEEELYDILNTVEEEGVVDEEQGDLMKSALEFGDTTAAGVMTMRADICALDISLKREEFLTKILSSNHSRIPVYDGDLDHIIGTLSARAFMKAYLQDPEVPIEQLLIKPHFVDAEEKIDDLLPSMSQQKFYLAIVRDKDLHTVGLVTIEDFLEELVGEIWDEDDVVDHSFMKLGGNHFLVDTKISVWEMYTRLGKKIPYDCANNRPVLSWLLEKFGCLPDEFDSFTEGDMTVTVRDVEYGKVTRIEVELPQLLPGVADDAAEKDGNALHTDVESPREREQV